MSEPKKAFAKIRGFEADVFISYAHLDNEPELLEDKHGWVDEFHHALQTKLKIRLSSEVLVWRDVEQLAPNDSFAKKLDKTAAGSVVIMPIVSPAYVRSEWCVRELELFLEEAQKTGEVDRRVFPVIKQFVEIEERPARIQEALGIELFRKSGEYTTPLDPTTAELREQYLDKINEIAGKLTDFLKEFVESVPPAAADAGTVFLLDTVPELEPARDKIKWELKEQGYRVLPDEDVPWPSSESGYRGMVKFYLLESDLVVQMIAAQPVNQAQDQQGKLLQLQHQMTSEDTQLADMLEGASLQQLKSRIVDDYLGKKRNKNGGGIPRIMWREAPLTVSNVTTEDVQKSGASPAEERAGPVESVYVICEVGDADNVEVVADCIVENELTLSLPLFGGPGSGVRDEQGQIVDHHRKQLDTSDAFVVYYGHGSDVWLNCNLDELFKTGARRGENLPPPIVFLGEPDTPAKRMVKYRKHITVVKNRDELDAALKALRGHVGRVP